LNKIDREKEIHERITFLEKENVKLREEIDNKEIYISTQNGIITERGAVLEQNNKKVFQQV
jgi:hypothetical protein